MGANAIRFQLTKCIPDRYRCDVFLLTSSPLCG
jgi:hypothetical protein